MKFFKNRLAIVALCAINSMNAQVVSSPTTKYTGGTPIKQVQEIQLPTGKTYADLVKYVKEYQYTWDNQKQMLHEPFVNQMIKAAEEANLEEFQLKALLQTARDKHAIFTGNPEKDRAILEKINIGIDESAKALSLTKKDIL